MKKKMTILLLVLLLLLSGCGAAEGTESVLPDNSDAIVSEKVNHVWIGNFETMMVDFLYFVLLIAISYRLIRIEIFL